MSFQLELDLAEARQRIETALECIALGSFDGAHHKQYALDQVLRALTGCPMVEVHTTDYTGTPYSYTKQGESAEYIKWCEDYRGEYDPEWEEYEYGEWDEGIAP